MSIITKILALGLSLSTFGCVVGSDAGKSDEDIIGGTVDNGDPSVVQIRFSVATPQGLGESECTGTVISPNAILTAAHCTTGFSYQYNRATSADPFSSTSTDWLAATAAIG